MKRTISLLALNVVVLTLFTVGLSTVLHQLGQIRPMPQWLRDAGVAIVPITYYGRNDGGSGTECTGQADAPYDGSGSGEACAFEELQHAIDIMTYTDTVILKAGDTFVPPLEVFAQPYALEGKGTPPTGTDADYMTIKSSGAASLSGRVCKTGLPCTADRANMAKILASSSGGAFVAGGDPGGGTPTTTQKESKYWKLQGLEITNDRDAYSATVGYFITVGTFPNIDHIWVDQCYIHPEEDGTNALVRSAQVGFTVGTNDPASTIQTNFVKVSRSQISGFGGGYYPYDPPLEELNLGLAMSSNVVKNFTLDNNLLEGGFQPWFPAGADPVGHSSGVVQASPAPTLTTARLSNVAGINIGDWLSVEQATLGNNCNAQAQVTGISGSDVTFTSVHHTTDAGFCGGNAGIAPPVGSSIHWDGLIGENYTITDNTFRIDANVARGAYAISGNAYVTGAADASTDTITGLTHSFGAPLVEGEAIFFHDDVPGGITGVSEFTPSTYTPYYARNVTGTTTQSIQVSTVPTGGSIINITSNTTATQLSNAGSSPKGYIEWKMGLNVLIEGNIFEGWPSGIFWNTVNQKGDTPWVCSGDITFRNNWIKDSGAGLILKSGSAITNLTRTRVCDNFHFLNNLFSNNANEWMKIEEVGENFRVEHNTVITPPALDFAPVVFILTATVPGTADGPATNSSSIKDNIWQYSRYGFNCGYTGDLPACITSWPDDANNAIRNDLGVTSDATIQAIWPSSFLATGANVLAFVGSNPYTISDWVLTTAAYKAGGARDASDGKDNGVVMSELLAGLAGNDGFTQAVPPPASLKGPTKIRGGAKIR